MACSVIQRYRLALQSAEFLLLLLISVYGSPRTFVDWKIAKSESDYANRDSPSRTSRIDNNSGRETASVHSKVTKGALDM